MVSACFFPLTRVETAKASPSFSLCAIASKHRNLWNTYPNTCNRCMGMWYIAGLPPMPWLRQRKWAGMLLNNVLCLRMGLIWKLISNPWTLNGVYHPLCQPNLLWELQQSTWIICLSCPSKPWRIKARFPTQLDQLLQSRTLLLWPPPQNLLPPPTQWSQMTSWLTAP